MFDDEYAVAPVPKLTKEFYKALCITRMQTNARLVEHIEQVGQVTVELACHLDPLAFASGKSGDRAVERKI